MRANPLADVEPLVRRVYAYVAYRIGDGPEAEDVTNDVFLRAVKYRDTYDARKGSPIGWLIGIARRAIDEAKAAQPPTQPLEDVPERASAETLADDAVRRLEVQQALQRLGPRERELIALRYGSDLTAKQIGEVVGMSTNAVEVALHRALRQLREATALVPDGRRPAARPAPPAFRPGRRERGAEVN